MPVQAYVQVNVFWILKKTANKDLLNSGQTKGPGRNVMHVVYWESKDFKLFLVC